MNLPRNTRLIVVNHGMNWQATVRLNSDFVVGNFRPTVFAAIEDAVERFLPTNPDELLV